MSKFFIIVVQRQAGVDCVVLSDSDGACTGGVQPCEGT